jgi:hypothetical protein
MTWNGQGSKGSREVRNECGEVRSEFSAYLDGAVSGVDFAVWREVQRSLVELGSAQPPMGLQGRLRATLAAERERGTHLPLHRRMLLLWRTSLAPVVLRFSGGLAAAAILAGGLSWMFGAPIAVQANDDGMAHLVGPRYVGSNMPLEPITTRVDVPVVVEAMVDSKGRVYDYTFLEGPSDPAVRVRVENNLLGSIFQPATVFGVPVRGHLVVTYTGIFVRG